MANPARPGAGGGPTRFGGGTQRGGAQGLGRPAQNAARPTGGAGGASAALVQKDAQIQELNNEVCFIFKKPTTTIYLYLGLD